MTRYAIYYAPRPEEDLARFGECWLNADPALRTPAFSIAELREITAEPRRYGFHGTLKSPFALAEGTTERELANAVASFARQQPSFVIPSLTLAFVGTFIALIPEERVPALDSLAADCVRFFDRFREPPPESELARRRRAGLTPRQEEMLTRWGYPHVFEEFRFHLTLTGKLNDEMRTAVMEMLMPLTAHFWRVPVPVRDLTIFIEDSAGAPFRVLARYPLAGAG